jgi:tetratricopeptide (TPR) repeat protein
MIIGELICNIKSGWHSGKGHKATRQGKYEKALRHYQLAFEYETQNGKCGSGPNPVTIECLAHTHARLGNYEEALLAAEISKDLFNKLNTNTKFVDDCIKRVEHFIATLKAGNKDEINKSLIV